jgi:hypothetical protein
MAKENEFDTTTTLEQPNQNSGNSGIDINTINDYELIEQAYEGTAGFKTGKYLVPHHREMFYDTRRQYSSYVNYIKKIIDAMYKPIFNEPFLRDFGNNIIFTKFEKNTTGNKVNMNKFVQLCMKYVRMHSVVFVVVDNHKQTKVSQEEALKNGEIPYAYIKKSYELNLDGTSFSPKGELLSIMFYDHCITKKNSSGVNDKINFFRFWDSKKTILYEENPEYESTFDCCNYTLDPVEFNKKYTAVDTVFHNLGEIPVYIAYEELPDKPQNILPVPSRYGIMKMNHTIFNQDSERRNLERDQGFSLLVIPEEDSETNDVNVGTNNYIGFPPESRHKPDFVSPDPNILKQLLEERKNSQESLIELADQSGVQGITKSKDAKSGIALAFEFFAHDNTLQESSKIATEIELNIVRLFNLWTNEKVKYEPNYPKNFKPNKVLEIHQLQNDILELATELPKAFRDKLFIEKFKLMYPDDKEGLEKLKKQLESMDDVELNQDRNENNEE